MFIGNASVKQQIDTCTDQTILCLHDFISLGEVELGLSKLPEGQQLERSQYATDLILSGDEVSRLPFLLRILQLSRPLSSIPLFSGIDDSDDNCKSELLTVQDGVNTENMDKVEELTMIEKSIDPIICDAVNRLEDRAAMYSISEGVEIVSCYLSPAVTRYVSRVPPLASIKERSVFTNSSEKMDSQYLEKRFDTSLLERSVERTTSKRILRKRSGIGISVSKGKKRRPSAVGNESVGDDDYSIHDSESSCEEMNNDSKRSTKKQAQEMEVCREATASVDSQESTTLRTLHDLVRVTVLSLKQSPSAARPNGTIDDENADYQHTISNSSNRALCISMQDSALSEAARTKHLSQTGTCDLPSTVASLMHNAPCLSSRHVAIALCRAALSQAPEIILRIGANCPASVPSMLTGCIDVYRLAASHPSVQEQKRENHHAIAMICKAAICKLSTLSSRDMGRIGSKLHSEGVLMMALQLELCMGRDPLNTACFIIMQLSGSNIVAFKPTLESEVQTLHSADEPKEYSYYPKSIDLSLKEHLLLDEKLISRTLRFLTRELAALLNAKTSLGSLRIFLRAYSWILYRCTDADLVVGEQLFDTIDYFELFVSSISSRVTDFPTASEQGLSAGTLWGDFYALVVVALLLTFLMTFSTLDSEDAILDNQHSILVLRKKICEAIRIVLQKSCSLHMTVDFTFLARNALTRASYVSLEYILQLVLCPHDKLRVLAGSDSQPCVSLAEKLSKAVTWLSSIDFPLDECSMNLPGPTILLTRIMQEETESTKMQGAMMALKSILTVNNSEIIDFVQDPAFVALLFEASRLVHLNEGNIYPVISFSQINSNFSSTTGSLQVGQLVIVLYCFMAKEYSPESLIGLDPRQFPLKEVYASSEKYDSINSLMLPFCRTLRKLIDKHCAEVKIRARLRYSQKADFCIETKKQKNLTHILRMALTHDASDPAGFSAAIAYNLSKGSLSDASLATSAMSGLMSSRASPPVFFTYSMLYRDPLTILKCDLGIWSSPGLRSIALSLFAQILEVNDVYLEQAASNENSLLEYLESRNLILIQCLIRIFAGQREEVVLHVPSPLVYGVVRTLLSRNKGVLASLVRLGLQGYELDWLIEVSPEITQDVSVLAELISDKSSLSPSERLVSSDCLIRIAVLHGYQDDSLIVTVIQTAFSHMLNGFFLIVGQPATPLSYVATKGATMDTVKVSRNAAFRVLKILQRVRLYRTEVRNECILFLQKFISLCRGESLIGTLPAASANRPKGLLKELLEAACKAAEAIGVAIQTA